MMHIDEKNVGECKGCVRFPMARIIVTAKKSSVMIHVSQERLYLRAPEPPKTPNKATLESDFSHKILNCRDNAPNGDQSISLSSFLYRTCNGS